MTVLSLERQNVGDREAVVGIGCGFARDVDDHRGRDEPLERHLVSGEPALGEMNRRIEVRAAMLRRRESER